MKTSISEISNPFDVHRELFKHLDSFEGMTFDRLKETLEAEGFRDMGKTPGGYHKFYGPGPKKERAEIYIRPDGQVERVGHSRNNGSRRFNHKGEVVNHSVGEFLRAES